MKILLRSIISAIVILNLLLLLKPYDLRTETGKSSFRINALQEAEVVFDQVFGGKNEDVAHSIRSKKYSGTVTAGYTSSKKTGDSDFWILRLSPKGKVIWEKSYGGLGEEKAYSINTTKDGGFICTGTILSKEERGSDIWILKLSGKGDVQWMKKIENTAVETARDIMQTSDGGYILAGSTTSEGSGFSDFLIIKLNNKGNITWKKVFGGSGQDEAFSIDQTHDMGYIVAGTTGSKGAGGVDGWVIKLDKNGKALWEKTLGGQQTDALYHVSLTKDNGFILSGYSDSYASIWRDGWVIKLDQNGKRIFEKVYGGEGVDEIRSIKETQKGEYIAAGSTTSKGTGPGGADIWVIKIGKDGKKIWDHTFGGKGEDQAYSIDITEDGGYAIAGFTGSRGKGESDFNIIKILEK
ncbi:MAG: hypothetical protein KKH98_04400 [Spirochaetes bacterium]|nr:hypothetical protein [Spirochaetota bacterium]